MSTDTIILLALCVVVLMALTVIGATLIIKTRGKSTSKRAAQHKLKGLFGKAVVIIVLGLNIWFAARVFALVEAGMEEPTVLTGVWFGFTTGELLALAGIKIKKQRKEITADESES